MLNTNLIFLKSLLVKLKTVLWKKKLKNIIGHEINWMSILQIWQKMKMKKEIKLYKKLWDLWYKLDINIMNMEIYIYIDTQDKVICNENINYVMIQNKEEG